MEAFVWDKFVYIKCPKNGCMTYSTLLQKHGWTSFNLFENKLNLHNYTIWGHLTNPEQRHTKGLNQYLINNPEIKLDESIGKILVSGVFDEHTYSLSMMMGQLFHHSINWIPLDIIITNWLDPENIHDMDGDTLTNNFFKEHNIKIQVTANDRLNVASANEFVIRQQLTEYKIKYNNQYQKLVKNFLEPDIILYNQTFEKFRKKYGSVC